MSVVVVGFKLRRLTHRDQPAVLDDADAPFERLVILLSRWCTTDKMGGLSI